MRNDLNKLTKYLVSSALAATFIIGCGKSDPLENYPNLKNGQAQKDDKIIKTVVVEVPVNAPQPTPPPKEYFSTDNFSILWDNNHLYATGEERIVFTQGLAGSIKLSGRVLRTENVNFELISEDLPSWVRLVPDTKSNQGNTKAYLLQGTAPYGTIDSGKSEKVIKFTLKFKLKAGGNAEVTKKLERLENSRTYHLIVRHTEEAPQIDTPKMSTGQNLLNSLSEGNVLKFYVDVKDPAAFEGNAPNLTPVVASGADSSKVIIPYWGNLEPNFDAGYPDLSQATKGIYRFHFKLDTKDRVVQKVEGQKEVYIRFALQAFSSVTNSNSISSAIEIKIIYKIEEEVQP